MKQQPFVETAKLDLATLQSAKRKSERSHYVPAGRHVPMTHPDYASTHSDKDPHRAPFWSLKHARCYTTVCCTADSTTSSLRLADEDITDGKSESRVFHPDSKLLVVVFAPVGVSVVFVSCRVSPPKLLGYGPNRCIGS